MHTAFEVTPAQTPLVLVELLSFTRREAINRVHELLFINPKGKIFCKYYFSEKSAYLLQSLRRLPQLYLVCLCY